MKIETVTKKRFLNPAAKTALEIELKRIAYLYISTVLNAGYTVGQHVSLDNSNGYINLTIEESDLV